MTINSPPILPDCVLATAADIANWGLINRSVIV